jgi:hypothetical protein
LIEMLMIPIPRQWMAVRKAVAVDGSMLILVSLHVWLFFTAP